MQFNSYIFILLFFPAAALVRWLLKDRNTLLSLLWLIITGTVFYLYGGTEGCGFLFISIAANGLFSYLVTCPGPDKSPVRRWLYLAALAFNVLSLLYFKYRGFFTGSSPALPLGVSFFTFQQIAWLVYLNGDPSRGFNLPDYLAYVLYFPKLLMGPIVEPELLIPQLRDKTRMCFNSGNTIRGIKLFSIGLCKKLVLADVFAKSASWLLTNTAGLTLSSTAAALSSGISPVSSLDALIGTFAYTMQIYFDFSGYSDMAVGLSLILNIDLPFNFNSPYKALSVADFWKRWHMSLTCFLTRHVYIPLGGNRRGTLRTCLNIIIVFLISGLWHGSSVTFLLWGLLHGLFSVFDRLAAEFEKKLPSPLRWFLTFAVISLLWLLFASGSVEQWLSIIRILFSFTGNGVSASLAEQFSTPETAFVLSIISTFTKNLSTNLLFLPAYCAVGLFVCLVPENACRLKDSAPPRWAVLSSLLLVWGIISLAGESVFIYSGF